MSAPAATASSVSTEAAALSPKRGARRAVRSVAVAGDSEGETCPAPTRGAGDCNSTWNPCAW